MATPDQYVYYQQYLESIIADSDLARLNIEIGEMKREKADLESVKPIDEKHNALLKAWIDNVSTKINLAQRMLSVGKTLIHNTLKLVPNTFHFTKNGAYFCKCLSYNGTPNLIVGTATGIQCFSLEQARQLKFYLATHEDDF